jgi:hypothetical protein
MNRNLETGQLHDFLKSLGEKSDFDKAFEEAGLKPRKRKAILHIYSLYFILEIDDVLRFYASPQHFLFTASKSEMPEELFKLLTSLSTTFEFPFTTDFIKTNYRRAKKLWLDTEEDFEIASPSDPLTITYSSDTQKYSFGLLYIYRQLNGKTQRLDLRDIDREFLEEIFLMNVDYYPREDFTKSYVFYEFYLNLIRQIHTEIPRKLRRIDIESRVVRDENYKHSLDDDAEIQY